MKVPKKASSSLAKSSVAMMAYSDDTSSRIAKLWEVEKVFLVTTVCWDDASSRIAKLWEQEAF